MQQLAMLAILPLFLAACVVVVDDDDQPWTTVGVIVEDTETGGVMVYGSVVCADPLDANALTLEIECANRLDVVCEREVYLDEYTGMVCCSDFWAGSQCVMVPADEGYPGHPACPDGYYPVCDYV